MKPWSLKRTKQCNKCPFKTTTNPFDIPNGYSVENHLALQETIADKDGNLSKVGAPTINVMSCHDNQDSHCIGWLYNQLGRGNNIPMRINMMSCTNVRQIKIYGPQHSKFEDTLPTLTENL